MKKAMKTLFAVSLLFAGIFSVLLIINSIQLSTVSLPDNPRLEAARENAVSGGGNDEELSFYRELHYLVRRVFFLKTSQIALARWFLVVSLGLALFSLQVLSLTGTRLLFPVMPGKGRRAPFNRVLTVSLLSLLALIPAAALAGSFLAERALADVSEGIGVADADGGKTGDEGDDGSTCPCTAIYALQSVYKSVAEDSEGAWSGFRGAAGTGVDRSAKSPLSWNLKTGENILWNIALPRSGKSSPVVWGRHVYVTGVSGENEGLTCFDVTSGKKLWDADLASAGGNPLPPVPQGETRERAASTPSADSKGVYVFFDDGTLAAFDHGGKLLWAKSLGAQEISYGYASSLRCYAGKLFVQLSGEKGRLLVVDTADGSVTASADCGEGSSWASPILLDTGKEVLVAALGAKAVVAASPSDGKVFWSLPLLSGEIAPSLAFSGLTLYAVSPNYALHAVDPYKGQALWANEEGPSPSTSSPVAADGLVYCATSFGVLFCVNGTTGATAWTDELETGWNASPLVLGDRLYLFDTAGTARIYPLTETKPEPSVVALTGIDTPSLDATPAYSGGALFIRVGTKNGDRLFAAGEKP